MTRVDKKKKEDPAKKSGEKGKTKKIVFMVPAGLDRSPLPVGV
jgi:hypothetical protein